jgi:hypothetical protein
MKKRLLQEAVDTLVDDQTLGKIALSANVDHWNGLVLLRN